MEQTPDPRPSPLSTNAVTDNEAQMSMVRAVDGGEGDSGNSVGYAVPAVPLPAIVGKGYREGELDAHADEASAITGRFNALANTAIDVVQELMVGEHSRGASTRLAACSTILDRVAPRLGVAGSTGGLTINAAQLAVIVGGAFHSVPPSTPASPPATLPQPLPPTV